MNNISFNDLSYSFRIDDRIPEVRDRLVLYPQDGAFESCTLDKYIPSYGHQRFAELIRKLVAPTAEQQIDSGSYNTILDYNNDNTWTLFCDTEEDQVIDHKTLLDFFQAYFEEYINYVETKIPEVRSEDWYIEFLKEYRKHFLSKTALPTE